MLTGFITKLRLKKLNNTSSVKISKNSVDFELPQKLLWHLILSQAATVLLFVNELQVWMLGLIALCLLWRISVDRERLQVPNKFTIVLLALSGAVLIALTSRSLGLLVSMIHLINFAFIMKAMELKKRRDFFQIILIGLFLHACALIFIQSVWFSLLVIAVILINLSLLYRYFSPESDIKGAYSDTAKYTLISIPLAAALFVFFPRISPFWQMPTAKSTQTGLGDTVQPGDIAQLAMSDELAFRVEFDAYAPSAKEMYWRAMTLTDYDGRRWQRSENQWTKTKGVMPEGNGLESAIRYDYQVIAEPSYRRWLFALDTAQINDTGISQLTDFSLTNNTPITKTMSYRVRSYPTALKDSNINRYTRITNLKLPTNSNPRLTALGQSLINQFDDKQQLINHVLDQYREKNYFYTLKPPLLTNNSLDEFYFDTRAGFCEHYASSFTFLMRAAGVPARLVTGYLGGEYNKQANYYSVYQYDAHAWAEVWLEGRGWVTVDPTAAVNPERVSDNMSSALQRERDAVEESNWRWVSKTNIWLKVRMQFEAIDYEWTRLIVGYSIDKQHEFLSQLFGSDKFAKAIITLTLTFVLVVISLWLWGIFQARSIYHHSWQKPLGQTLILLENQGISRAPSQSLGQLSDNVKEKLPAIYQEFLQLTEHYQQVQYAQSDVTNIGSNSKLQRVKAKAFARECKAFNRLLKKA